MKLLGREELIPKRMMKVNPGRELFAELQLICESYCFQADDKNEHLPGASTFLKGSDASMGGS